MRNERMLFPGGVDNAVTFSFDDAVTQDERLIALFDKYQVKGTFNLNSGLFGIKEDITNMPYPSTHNKVEKERVSEIYKNHEIAVHGYKHMNPERIPTDAQMYDLVRDKYELEKYVDYPIRGMAYAYGGYTNETKEILKLLKLDFARTVNSTHAFEVPKDFLEWNPTCHYADSETLNLIHSFLYEEGPWGVETRLFYLWGHSFELDGMNHWELMEDIVKGLAGKENVWYATNGQICDYVTAYRNLDYNMDGSIIYNNSNIDLWMDICGKAYCIKANSRLEVQE